MYTSQSVGAGKKTRGLGNYLQSVTFMCVCVCVPDRTRLHKEGE